MTPTPQEMLARRVAILNSWREIGATATAKKFGISRNAVYLILDAVRFGTRKKPAHLKTPRPPKNSVA